MLIESSLYLASQHVKLFRCYPNSKLPAVDQYSQRATSDPQKIKELFSKGDYNSGIACGWTTDKLFLCGVDIDHKPEKNRFGFETLKELERQGFVFPETWSQSTPTGGLHMLFWSPVAIRQGADVTGLIGLDLRGEGGYLVGPGSSLNGKFYNPVKEAEIATLPQWAVDRFKKDPQVVSLVKSPFKAAQDQILALKRSVDYLNSLEPAKDGHRNDSCYKIAGKLKDFGLGQMQMEEIMLTYWKCEPMLEVEEVRSTIEHVFRYGKKQPAVDAPENVFTKIDNKKGGDKDLPPPELEFNKDHFFVASDGNSWVCWETKDKGEFHLERFPVSKFHEKHLSKTLMGEKRHQISKLWMQSPQRRTYDRIRFDPSNKDGKNIYNLWKGFNVKALPENEKPSAEAQESVHLFMEHCLENVCMNDTKLYEWLMGFFADIFQNPGQKPRVAVVFKGLKGTGKSIIGKILSHLIGWKNTAVIPDKSHLTNHFNALLEDKLLLVLEEAFWSGDKSVEGILKSLITDSHRVITYKGAQPYMTEVYDRIMIIGNDDHIVPASGEERRFAVFNIGTNKMQDQEFFGRMLDGIYDKGGDQLLMRFFMNYDLSQINVNQAPQTKGLQEQKENSMPMFERWWRDCLFEERIIGSNFEGWPDTIKMSDFYDAFLAKMQNDKVKGYFPTHGMVGRILKRTAPSMTGKAKRENGSVHKYYFFPPVEVLQLEFDRAMNFKTEWHQD